MQKNICLFIAMIVINICTVKAQNVGIGTTTPTEKLHIVGATDADVIVKNESAGTLGSASFQAKGTGGLYDVFQMTKYNASTGGSVAGVNLANLSLLYTGVNAGPMLFDVISANSMQMATSNTVRMTLDPNGNVGIGTITPSVTLHVKSTLTNPVFFDGGTNNTWFSIFENGVYRGYWGSYAGNPEDIDIGTGGGNLTGKMHLTIQGTPKLTVDNLGNVGIGTVTPATLLHLLGTSSVDVKARIEAVGPTGSAGVQVKGSASTTDILELTKYNASAVGTLGGISIAGLSALNSSATGALLVNSAGALYLNSVGGTLNLNANSANNMNFYTNNILRSVINSNGKFIINNGTTTHGLFAIKATTDTIALYLNESNAPTVYGTERIEYTGITDVNRVGLLSTTIRSISDVNGTGIEGAGNSLGVQGLAESSTASQVQGIEGDSYGSGTYSVGVGGYSSNYIAAPTNCYGVYGYASGGATNYAVYADGAMRVNGALSKASGTFEIDHPLDPSNKYLYHSFVESPDMMNIYNGNITTDANGIAVVTLPDYFDALNKDFRYQLTAIGTFAQAIISKKISNNVFEIKTSQPNVEVSWQVTGVRQDAWANAHRVIPEVDKKGTDKGKYLHPKEFGLPDSMRIGGDIKHGTKDKNVISGIN